MQLKEYIHQKADSRIDISTIQNVRSTLQAYQWPRRQPAADFRDALLISLGAYGWSNRVRIDPRSRINITSVLNTVGLCIQTGNMSRFYADLLKLETVFKNKVINGAIYILPIRTISKEINQNCANFERFIEELEIFELTITIPIMVFGISGRQ